MSYKSQVGEDESLLGYKRSSQTNERSVIRSNISSNDRLYHGIAYMMCTGMCGITLVSTSSTLPILANNIESRLVELGTVHLCRGVGAIIGMLISIPLCKYLKGNNVLIISLMLTGLVISLLPQCRSSFHLHFLFLCLGLSTSVTDFGCQILTYRLHVKSSILWLGGNSISFGVYGAIAPLTQLLFHRINEQYIVIIILTVIICLILALAPEGETHPSMSSNKSDAPIIAGPRHYRVEAAVSTMLFCLYGGLVSLTACIGQYIIDCKLTIASSHTISTMLFILWTGSTLGRIVGVLDVVNVTNTNLFIHFTGVLLGGCFSMMLVACFPSDSFLLWICIVIYGISNGPSLCFCYNLIKRLTHASDYSYFMLIFGLNLGSSFIPFITMYMWDYYGPNTLVYFLFLTTMIPLPLLFFSKLLSNEGRLDPELDPI
mmetsp:Transcript_26783/g.27021  ORF Transcript_26783/g.27021 Transcript_26783/m.27021 type:complete len:431 (-) Transcript_26783:167-1459(-)